jgi:asparaginyl-tRNA synthetase
MKTVSVQNVLAGKLSVGENVCIRGWVRTRRDSKAGVSFVHVSDGSCFDPIQLVVPSTLANYASEVLHLSTGCAVEAEGTIASSLGQGQKVELDVAAVRVVGWVTDPEKYPLQPKHHSLEFLREIAHLRPRSNTFGAVARVRHTMGQAIHRYFHERQFVWVNTPILTTSDCEGAGHLFRVSTLDLANVPRDAAGRVDYGQDFFGKAVYLTVSGQLNVEPFCLALSKVYTFGPTFRAENSNTTRHLSEFWMVEPEIAFATLEDDADLAEEFLKYVVKAVLSERPDDMKFFADRVEKTAISRLEHLAESTFERIDYGEAIALLEKADAKFEYPVRWGADLQTEHERYLTEEKIGRPVIVTNYPEEIKAFYMRLNDDGKTVAAMDILAPGVGEIVGGSQREERLDVLERRMAAHGLEKSAYEWYLDLRRYGTVAHAGFGLGFERLLVYVTGLSNIRDAIPYPRAPKTAEY